LRIANRRFPLLLALVAVAACRRGAREPDTGAPEAAVQVVSATPAAPAPFAAGEAKPGSPLEVRGEAVELPVATVVRCAGACRVARLRMRSAADGAGGVGTRLYPGDTFESPTDGEAELETVDARITLRIATRVSLGSWAPEELLLHRGALEATSLADARVHLDLCTAAGMIRFRGRSLAASVTPAGVLIVRSSNVPPGEWQSLELLDGFATTHLPFGEPVRITLDGVVPSPENEADVGEAGAGPSVASVPERLRARIEPLLADVEAQRARVLALLARTGEGATGEGAADASPAELEAELTAAAARSAGADRMLAAAWYRLSLLDPDGAERAELEPRVRELLERVPSER
jgi:hypothetical protein